MSEKTGLHQLQPRHASPLATGARTGQRPPQPGRGRGAGPIPCPPAAGLASLVRGAASPGRRRPSSSSFAPIPTAGGSRENAADEGRGVFWEGGSSTATSTTKRATNGSSRFCFAAATEEAILSLCVTHTLDPEASISTMPAIWALPRTDRSARRHQAARRRGRCSAA